MQHGILLSMVVFVLFSSVWCSLKHGLGQKHWRQAKSVFRPPLPGSLAFGSLGVLVCRTGGLGGTREMMHVQSLAQNLAAIKCAATTAVVTVLQMPELLTLCCSQALRGQPCLSHTLCDNHTLLLRLRFISSALLFSPLRILWIGK